MRGPLVCSLGSCLILYNLIAKLVQKESCIRCEDSSSPSNIHLQLQTHCHFPLAQHFKRTTSAAFRNTLSGSKMCQVMPSQDRWWYVLQFFVPLTHPELDAPNRISIFPVCLAPAAESAPHASRHGTSRKSTHFIFEGIIRHPWKKKVTLEAHVQVVVTSKSHSGCTMIHQYSLTNGQASCSKQHRFVRLQCGNDKLRLDHVYL